MTYRQRQSRQADPHNLAKVAPGINRLWLLIVPPLLSLALISAIKPSGPLAFWTETSIFCLCSLVCGFGLAIKQFKKARHRILGALAFSAGGMYLICCMSFLGCFLPSGPRLTPAQIKQNLHQEELERRAWIAKQVVARDSSADSSMLDLSPYYDGIVTGPELVSEGTSYLQIQQPGTHVWDGIKFDVRGTIGSSWLVETNAIAVGRKCSEVYFLHGDSGGNPTDVVNQFFIHFQNGHTETIPIFCGSDVSSDVFATGIVSTNAVVWEQMTSTNGTPQPFFGFFIKKWVNPFPDETITSIGFAPQYGGYLVAITIKEAANSSP